MPSPLPIFIHIHKCGGSSLSAVMRRNLRHRSPELRPASCLDALQPPKLVHSILSSAQRDGYVMGHIGYGSHRIFETPCSYFTMLREPRERLISLWRYSTSNPKAYYHKAAKGLTFKEFLNKRRPLELDNGMVRFISGDPSEKNVFINPKPFGSLDESDLQRALENLEHRLDGFGVVEHFDQSLLLMKPLIGLQLCLYARRNVSPNSAPKPIFPDEASALISLDEILYKEASRIFFKRINRQPPRFQASLRSFQATNRAVQPIFALRSRLGKMRPKLALINPHRTLS
jgi:hypothetical protein